MTLLERDIYLEELAVHLRQAAAGCGRVVLIGGEAGVGKSALVDEFSRRHRGSARVLKAACDSLSTPIPLGPLLDIGPALGLNLEQMLQPSQRRDELFHAVLNALRACDEPLMILAEDAHWSDEATMDLLRFLSRRIENLKVLFLVTYRDDELGPFHPLRRLMGDLASTSTIYRLTLSPLSEDAVRTLAGGTAHDPAVLYRRTGGNPFFVTEVLATDNAGVPRTVADAVLARAARLSPEARSVLEVSAVIGSTVEADLLMRVAGPVVEAMEECITGGLLRQSGDGLAFRHELSRDAILATIAAPRRRLLHQRVLTALRSDPASAADYARLAHHADASGDVPAIREFALAAAEQASALYSHREEAAQYARVLRVAGDLGERERALLLEKYSFACYVTAQGEEAIRARREAIDIWRRAGDPSKEGENLRWLSRLLWVEGQNAEAQQAGTAALEVLQRLPLGPQLAMAYSNLSQLEMLRWNEPAAVAWGEQAIALAERLGERETFIHALINVGSARAIREDDEGFRQLERAHHLAAEAGMIDHAGRALTNSAWMRLELFQLDEAERQLAAAITYATEYDLDSYAWYLTAGRAMLRCYRGDWVAALDDVDRALKAPSLWSLTRIVALTVRGRVLTRRGDAGAGEALDQALELAEKTRELQRLGPVRLARAEVAWLAGDADRARAELEPIRPLAERFGTSWLRGEVAYGLHRIGATIDSLDRLAEPYALMIAGEWRRAAQAWREIGCRYESGYALANIDDEESIRKAELIFSALGARPAEAWTKGRLREIGIRTARRGPRASTRANLAGLTRREVDVLDLLAAGLSNADIAERLFITPKTAGHHVSAILAKLGVSSRTAAARYTTQSGDPSPRK